MSALIASIIAGNWMALIAFLAVLGALAFVAYLVFLIICYGPLRMEDAPTDRRGTGAD